MDMNAYLTKNKGSGGALVALGFYLLGLACLITLLGIVITIPTVLTGDPYRPEVLALAVLAVSGFIASCLFAVLYSVSSLLSGAPLWSRGLANWHLALHAFGLGLMVAAFAGREFLQQPFTGVIAGGACVLLGMLLLALNLIVTASRENRWQPAQLTVLSAIFWLLIAVSMGLAMVFTDMLPRFGGDPIRILEIQAHVGMAGFFWLGLLGCSLILLSMFVVGDHAAGWASWTGCVLLNLILLVMVPIILASREPPVALLAGAILAASCFYLIDIIAILSSGKRGPGSVSLAILASLLSGMVLIGWMSAGMQPANPAATELLPLRESARIYFGLAVFGTFVLFVLGSASRLIPFLVWRLRCLPWLGTPGLPEPAQLFNRASLFPMLICALAGAGYFAAGQIHNQSAGMQIGALCLLVATGWLLHAVLPAMRAFLLGIAPATNLPSTQPSTSKKL